MRLLAAYNGLLARHPVKLMSLTTGVLMSAGDVVAQKLIEERRRLDARRTAKFAAIGAALFGPAWTVWYRFLDGAVASSRVAAPLQGLVKVVVDQSLFAPALLLVFLYILDLPKEINPLRYWQSAKDGFKDIMLNYYKIWPGVQLLNFYLVPLRHRVMVINVVALFWNTFLAWKAGAAAGEGVEGFVGVEEEVLALKESGVKK